MEAKPPIGVKVPFVTLFTDESPFHFVCPGGCSGARSEDRRRRQAARGASESVGQGSRAMQRGVGLPGEFFMRNARKKNVPFCLLSERWPQRQGRTNGLKIDE